MGVFEPSYLLENQMSDDKKNPVVAAAIAAALPAPVGASLTPELMKILGEAIAMGIAMGKQSEAAQNAATSDAAIVARTKLRERCQVCLQLKTACKEEHVKMVCYPSDPIAQQVFDGITVNGVRYCSPNYSTQIDVPAANDIGGMIALFEKNERETRLGRKGSRDGGSWRSANASSNQHWR